MDQILQEKEKNNMLLEQELKALQEGKRNNLGTNGLLAIEEFEQLLKAIPQEEKNLIQMSLGQPVTKETIIIPKIIAPPIDMKNPMLNPMPFSQNIARNYQLSQAEKMQLNLQAQELDHLKMIDSFNALQGKGNLKNDELFQFKMNQFKELSCLRTENLKEANAQNVLHVKHQNQNLSMMQQVEAQKQDFQEIVERMQIVKQLQEISQMPRPNDSTILKIKPQHINREMKIHQDQIQIGESMSQAGISQGSVRSGVNIRAISLGSSSITDESSQYDREYDPFHGLQIHFDYCSRMFNTYSEMRMVFSLINVTNQLVDPVRTEVFQASVDPNDSSKLCIMLNKTNIFKGITAHPSINLIIEVQVPQANQEDESWFVSYGWTILNLFDYRRDLNKGIWKLPLYQSPTQASIDVRDIYTLKPIPNTVICMRMSNNQDNIDHYIREFDMRDGKRPFDYVIPEIHDIQDFQNQQTNESEQFSNKSDVKSIQDDSSHEDINEVDQEAGYDGRGIILKVHQIRNYIPISLTTVICTLYLGPKIVKTYEALECQFYTEARDFTFIKGNPKNKKEQYLRIGDQTFWDQNFYKLVKQNKENQDLTLIFEINEEFIDDVDPDGENNSDKSKRNFIKQFNAQEKKNHQRLYAYASIKLNNENGTIKYGTFDLNLFKPPINLRKRFAKDQIHDKEIKITIQMPESQEKDDVEEELQHKLEVEQKEEQIAEALMIREIPYVESAASHLNLDKLYRQGQGIDFYIDQVRYLPDCVTFTRLLIRGINNNSQKVIAAQKAFPEINHSTRMVQSFDFRMEIRPETLIGINKIDPTTFLEIVVETIDRHDMKEKIIGFAYFPLFLTKDGMQSNFDAADADQVGFIFNEGAYQIPVYYQRIDSSSPFHLQDITNLPKIQCATLLVRSYQCALDNKGKNMSLETYKRLSNEQLVQKQIIREHPGLYSKGIYNTKWCYTTQEENLLYKFKHKRYNPIMNLTVGYLLTRKGVKSSHSMPVQAIYDELDKIIGRATLNKAQLAKKFVNSYEPKYGFRLQIQRLHNLPPSQKEMAHFIVTQLVPPGRLLRSDPSMGPDVHVFKDQDFEGQQNSTWNSIQFTEEMNYIGLPAQDKIGFIFEVRAYNPKARTITEVQSLGWAYVPLYVTVENENKSYSLFTNSGLMQVPLFKGEVNKKKLIQALNSDDPMKDLSRDRELNLLTPTSILLRIHENQHQFKPNNMDYGDIDTGYLPPQNHNQYLYHTDQQKKSTEKPFSHIYNIDKDEHQNKVQESFKLAYGFKYPKIGNR